jgi:hypothetical protein
MSSGPRIARHIRANAWASPLEPVFGEQNS